MCGCAERREAIVVAASALVKGDMATVAQQGSVFVSSVQTDLQSLAANASAFLRRVGPR